jgi:hypothetical protein
MTILNQEVKDFWLWFADNRSAIESLLDRDDAQSLSALLTPRVKRLHPDFSWELGPGKKTEFALAISSAANRSLRSTVAEIVRAAPSLRGWEFYPARQPKGAPPKIHLVGRAREITTEGWRFVGNRRKDGKINLTIIDQNLTTLPKADAVNAVFLFLDSALGEDLVEEWIGDIQILDAIPAEGSSLPISDLRSFLVEIG